MASASTCASCSDGYGLSTNKLTCTKCEETNCKTCDGDGKTCSVCNTGYYVDTTEVDTLNVNSVCI